MSSAFWQFAYVLFSFSRNVQCQPVTHENFEKGSKRGGRLLVSNDGFPYGVKTCCTEKCCECPIENKMGLIPLKRCKRTFSVKKILAVLLCLMLVMYVFSVFHRVPKDKEIHDIVNFKNYTENFCGITCPYKQVSLYVKTGIENRVGPVLCFNDAVIFSEDKKNTGRGMNIAVIDPTTYEVVFTQTYDTYLSDHEFLQDMKIKVKDGQIVAVVSYDEISGSLRDESRRWLKLIGSELIDTLNFRDAFILIGQKGLREGNAIEFTKPRGNDKYAGQIEKLGCFFVPLGPVEPAEKMLQYVIKHHVIPKGDPLENCDVLEPCDKGNFPVMVSSGKDSTVFPEICVNGNMYMHKNLNDGGRGINLVVVDENSVIPKVAVRFDTYEKESTDMESFLSSLINGDIIIGVVFDDASRKLSFHARELLNQLGSSMSQNIKFRDVWYFVGQKGINGFTKFESISYAGIESEWPQAIKKSFCVPTKLEGSQVIPDIGVYRNDARREFCKAHDGYDEFCDPAHVDEPFPKAVGLVDDKLQENPVYSTPLLIIPGFNNNALIKTIQTTVMQPGVKLDNIVVTFDEKLSEQGVLAGLFGVRNISINSSTTYQDLMMKSMKKVAELYKDAKYIIVIEEELILASDFLHFMSQTYDILDRDSSILTVSAFNFNGYEDTSGNRSLLYKVEDFPGLAFLTKMSTVTEKIWRTDPKYCCSQRAWNRWSIYTGNHSIYEEMLVPDVSRAMRLHYQGSGLDEDYLLDLFNRKRLTNMKGTTDLKGLGSLTGQKYGMLITDILQWSMPLRTSLLKQCIHSKGKEKPKFDKYGGSFSVYYNQTDKSDLTVLKQLCHCFGLPFSDAHPPRNLYRGVLRLWYMQNEILFVGSQSQFAKYKPASMLYFS